MIPDISQIGEFVYSWDFDTDEYNEWIEEADLDNTEETLMDYINNNVSFDIEFLDNETYFKVLIEEVEGRYLPEEEFFPKYVKAHIDRGSELLLDMYNHAGNMDRYILQVLGVGDTV